MLDLIGTSVVVPGAQKSTGLLRYIGLIHGKSGTFGGIELQGPQATARGKNSGTVAGVRYFDVQEPMTGLFMPWDRLWAANPTLPPPERVKSRPASLNRMSVSTPTPLRRSSPSPRVYAGNLSLSESSRSFLRAASFSREPHRSNSYTKPVSDSPSAEPYPSQGRMIGMAELRAQLDAKTRDAERRETILLELQATVDQLHPVLEDYERSLEEKDRRLKKQRAEYDRAREEWRLSLDLMLSSQQETENLYEMQINDLKDEIQRLAEGQVSGLDVSEDLITVREENERLRAKLVDLELLLLVVQRENTELRSHAERTAPTNSLQTGKETEIVELLRKKVDMLTQDVTSMEIVLQDAQAKARAKSAEVARLEIQLEELTLLEVDVLLNKVGSIALEEWEKDRSQYQADIAKLEHKLESASSALSDTVGEKELEIAKLRETAVSNAAEITRLQLELQALQNAGKSAAVKADTISDAANAEKIAALTEQHQVSEEVIKDLRLELESRPSYNDNELTELQDSLEMVETLHREEIARMQQELERSQAQKAHFESEVCSLQEKLAAVLKPLEPGTESSSAKTYASEPTEVLSFQASNGTLPIYKPATEIDPSSGREDWCGLCERDGHDSLNCPYENDIF